MCFAELGAQEWLPGVQYLYAVSLPRRNAQPSEGFSSSHPPRVQADAHCMTMHAHSVQTELTAHEGTFA